MQQLGYNFDVGVGVKYSFLGAIFKTKWTPFFLKPFYMLRQDQKKNFDFGHFWAITGQKTDRTLFSAKIQAKNV